MLNEARAAFGRILDELAIDHASDAAGARFVLPTESGNGIVVEFVEIDFDDDSCACVVLILPLLRNIPTNPSHGALRDAARETAHMLFGKLVYDDEAGILEVRHELLAEHLSAAAVAFACSALSQHAALAEHLELAFGGDLGPNYQELLSGE